MHSSRPMNDNHSGIPSKDQAPCRQSAIGIFIGLSPRERRMIRDEKDLFSFNERLKFDESFFST